MSKKNRDAQKKLDDARTNSNSTTSTTVTDDYFNAAFKRVKNFINDPTVGKQFISGILDSIERRATNEWNDEAINFVAKYREKLRNR